MTLLRQPLRTSNVICIPCIYVMSFTCFNEQYTILLTYIKYIYFLYCDASGRTYFFKLIPCSLLDCKLSLQYAFAGKHSIQRKIPYVEL